MNYLFYLGIIAPTLVTILLFVIFVYCWFLQKARKEVLTKKYDPHGKMRRLGIPMDPPPPPAYCRIEDVTSRFVDDSGNDNGAYDVSRSPSTEQENRGRPLYHTYHDSGISAGLSLSLSPSQENEPRHGLSYRTCPDSGISGFGVPGAIGSSGNLTGPPPLPPPQHQHQHPHHQACRGCHQAREQMPQMHPHHHHHPQTHQQQQQQHHHQLGRPHFLHQLQPQQVMLHHNTIQASVHPTHGVCYGDDTTHPQSPQHYNPPPLQSSAMSSLGGRHFTTMPHIHEQPTHLSSSSLSEQNVCYCANSPDHHQRYNPHHQCCPEEILDGYNIHEEHPLSSPPAHPSTFRPQQNSSRALTLASSSPSSPRHESPPQANGQTIAINSPTTPTSPQHVGNTHAQHHHQPSDNNNAYPLQPQNVLPSSASSSSSSSSSQHQLPRHSHRDSGVMEVSQTMMGVSDRPDSQASTSSTTDSEDSGFRSSHCAAVAAHTNSKLSKHGNPLLKPLRRPRQNAKTRTKTTRAGGEVDPSIHGATPLSTLNPQNLQCQVANSAKHHNVIQTTSLLDDANNLRGQRSPPRILQKHNALKSMSNSIPEATTLPNNNSAGNYQNDSVAAIQSPGHGASHEATNTNAKQQQQQQHGDMTEISTHLSWKYLQDISGSSNGSHEPCASQDGLQMGHTVGANNKAPSQFHASPEPQMEMFSYSIV